MDSSPLNGKVMHKTLPCASQGDTAIVPSTIPLAVGGRKGLQPLTEGKFVWKVELGAKKNYHSLGERLSRCDDLYRNGSDGLGLIQVLPSGKTRLITRGFRATSR
jgi:hypothetical protein